MKPELNKLPGTIAYEFNVHIGEINDLMQRPSQWPQLKDKINEILDSEPLAKNGQAAKAKKDFAGCKSYNQYLSLFGTYLTGYSLTKHLK